jgi:hypothetical protein
MNDLFQAYSQLTSATRKRIIRENSDNHDELATKSRRVLREVNANTHKSTSIKGFDFLSSIVTKQGNHGELSRCNEPDSFSLVDLEMPKFDIAGVKSVSHIVRKRGCYLIVANNKKHERLNEFLTYVSDISTSDKQLQSCLGEIMTFLDWFKMNRYEYEVNSNNCLIPRQCGRIGDSFQSIIEYNPKLTLKSTHEILKIKALSNFLQVVQVKQLETGTNEVVLLFTAYAIRLKVGQYLSLAQSLSVPMNVNGCTCKLYLKWNYRCDT